jgi:hypothetical protein
MKELRRSLKKKSPKKNSSRRWNSEAIKPTINKAPLSLIFLALALLLSACGEQVARSTPVYYLPPTLSQKASPIPLQSPTPIPHTPTPICENNLTYVADKTIPDGTTVAPGDILEKIWVVQNSGTCNWDAYYRIRFETGELMGAEPEQALFPAVSGSEAEIRVVFTVPDTPGWLYSNWMAYTSNEVPFGDNLYISIIVDPDLAPSPTPVPTATRTPLPTLTPDTTE